MRKLEPPKYQRILIFKNVLKTSRSKSSSLIWMIKLLLCKPVEPYWFPSYHHAGSRFSSNVFGRCPLGAVDFSDLEKTMRICIKTRTKTKKTAQNTTPPQENGHHSKNFIALKKRKHDQQITTCISNRRINECETTVERAILWIYFLLTSKDFFGLPISWYSWSPNVPVARCRSNKAS